MRLELHLLGSPNLIKEGRVIRPHSSKVLALLSYLVLEADRHHSREKLATLLWGESSDTRARASLRQGLYSLRQMLSNVADACLEVGEGAVAFHLHPGLWVDALEFRTLAALDTADVDVLRRAAQLYQGALLEGLMLPDSPTFEEWLFLRRDTLEQQALQTLHTLVDQLIRQGAPHEALLFAQRLVALEPLYEGAYQHLMQIHAALGDRDGMRHQYRLCVDVLARELGVKPSVETQMLYRQLRVAKANHTVFAPEAPAPQPGDQLLELPFLGREHELAALQALLNETMEGRGGVILVSGESGIGKTRLIREFLRLNAAVPAGRVLPLRSLAGQCYESEARVPYAVWADALQPFTTAEWLPLLADLPLTWRQQLARLLPALASPATESEEMTVVESRLRLLQGVVQCLAHVTRSGALLLFFDDLQWADEASIELLHYVSRHLVTSPLLLIGTYRPEATADNPQLDQLLRRVGDAVAPSLLQLAPLNRETVDRLLMGVVTPLPADLPGRLYEHSEGNPFVLTETLRMLVESGNLQRESNDLPVTVEMEMFPIPRQVHDLIRARIARLGGEQRRVLAAAAVIGRPFDMHLLRRVSGLPEPPLLQHVDQLLARAFLRESGNMLPQQSLDFQHEYIRRVIYEDLGTVQRRVLHRRTAEALLARHRSRLQAVTEEVARHFEEAVDERAVPYLVRAAQQAEGLFAYAHATELYSRALALHRSCLADEPNRRFDLLLAREALLDRQGRRAEQAKDVETLLTVAEALGDTDRMAIVYKRQVGFFTYTGRYEEAQRVGEQALALYRAAGDRAGEAETLRELGFLHWSAGDYGTALAYGRQALQLHRYLGDTGAEATALHNVAEIYRELGSPRQALELYEQALNLHWARMDRRGQGLTLYSMAHALRELGDLQGALTDYQRALALCQDSGDRLMLSRVHHTLAGLQWEIGVPDQALAHLQHALGISREIGYGPGIAYGLIALGHFYGQQSERHTARQHFEEAITWLQLTEDQVGLAETQARLDALEQDTLAGIDRPTTVGWVKSHVALAEGKVYCEFESPMARHKS
jgi:DNA-binding SARP family transcriptional activator/tetratricopeptide (TPR) repeat protein